MTNKSSYFFASYSRKDQPIVYRILNDLSQRGINTWVDTVQLHPGDNWQDSITNGLKGSIGIIVFLSNTSVQSTYVMDEVNFVLRGGKAPIFPILLEDVTDIPARIRVIQWFDFRDYEKNYNDRIDQLAKRLNSWIDTPPADISEIDQKIFTNEENNRVTEATEVVKKKSPKAVFLVHGRDKELRDEVKSFLVERSVAPIILIEEKNNQRQSIFDKFYEMQAKADHAVILLTPDDIGAAISDYYQRDPEGQRLGERAFEGRGRQNVVFEMGFFYGRLGIERVFVLEKSRSAFQYKRPSDLDGRAFEDYNSDWKVSLTEWLTAKEII